MEDKRIQILVEKYIDGLATPAEEAELMDWYYDSNEQEIEWPATDANEKEVLKLKIFSVIQDKTFRRTKRIRQWPRLAAAVLVLVCLSVGGYFLIGRRSGGHRVVVNIPQDIRPGSHGAVLILAGGKKIILGQVKAGMIARQGQAALQKQNDSLLVYQGSRSITPPGNPVTYNILETPRGRQFEVVLPDGSRVWLNAASSLKYPTAFTGKTRTVELQGEAYFEVAHQEDQPFRVITSSQVVEDIGTHFDIMSYADESEAKTILLSGAVKVTLDATGQSRLLRPGEQAIAGRQIKVEKADTLAAVAWKDGEFIFRSTPVKSIMRQIARWYNVKIIYKNEISNKSVWGTVSRYANVSEVLNMIELAGVAHFKLEGNTIIVTK